MIIDSGFVSLVIDDLFVDHGCCRSPESMRMADNLEIFSIIELSHQDIWLDCLYHK